MVRSAMNYAYRTVFQSFLLFSKPLNELINKSFNDGVSSFPSNVLIMTAARLRGRGGGGGVQEGALHTGLCLNISMIPSMMYQQ